MKNKTLLTAIACIFLLTCCKTYTITPENFKEQMIHAKSSNYKEVKINNPLNYGEISYSSNNVKYLIVNDKDGNEYTIYNSPSIEMRITHRNGKKFHFYFDTVILENDTIFGGRSRFFQGLTRKIPLDSVSKIEIQDGGKKIHYQ